MRIPSLVEISSIRSEMSPPRAEAVFKETIIQAVIIAFTHLVTIRFSCMEVQNIFRQDLIYNLIHVKTYTKYR